MHICYLAKVHICYLLRNLEPIGVSPFGSVVMPFPQAVNKSANWLFVEKMTRTNVQSVNWLRNLSTNNKYALGNALPAKCIFVIC